MDNWNGFTCPLIVGDAVRILRCESKREYEGIITEVIMVLDAGTKVRLARTGEMTHLHQVGYVVKEPHKSSWNRQRLYKLPSDFFEVLDKRERVDSSPLAEKLEAGGWAIVDPAGVQEVIRKRLQEVD